MALSLIQVNYTYHLSSDPGSFFWRFSHLRIYVPIRIMQHMTCTEKKPTGTEELRMPPRRPAIPINISMKIQCIGLPGDQPLRAILCSSFASLSLTNSS